VIRPFPKVVPVCLGLALTIAAASASGQSESAVPAHSPTVAETLTAVRQISRELKLIEERLGRLEQSVAGVDASLKPVGSLASPETLRGLILLAAGCGAGLIVLHAILRRWGSAGRTKP
jgi:hypothetical protein